MEGGMAIWPGLGRVRMLRQWGGLMDMSMDGSPIIDKTPVDGLYLNCGWCYGGFKATPASGWCFAHLIARDEPYPAARRAAARSLRDRRADRRDAAPAPSRTCTEGRALRIPCPYCGARGNEEFTYLGDATVQRPDPAAPDAREGVLRLRLSARQPVRHSPRALVSRRPDATRGSW